MMPQSYQIMNAVVLVVAVMVLILAATAPAMRNKGWFLAFVVLQLVGVAGSYVMMAATMDSNGFSADIRMLMAAVIQASRLGGWGCLMMYVLQFRKAEGGN